MKEGGGGRNGGGRRPPRAYLSPARGRPLLHAEDIDMAVLCRGVPLPPAAAPPDPLRQPPDSPTPPHAREREMHRRPPQKVDGAEVARWEGKQRRAKRRGDR
jgi:hypothetical protein